MYYFIHPNLEGSYIIKTPIKSKFYKSPVIKEFLKSKSNLVDSFKVPNEHIKYFSYLCNFEDKLLFLKYLKLPELIIKKILKRIESIQFDSFNDFESYIDNIPYYNIIDKDIIISRISEKPYRFHSVKMFLELLRNNNDIQYFYNNYCYEGNSDVVSYILENHRDSIDDLQGIKEIIRANNHKTLRKIVNRGFLLKYHKTEHIKELLLLCIDNNQQENIGSLTTHLNRPIDKEIIIRACQRCDLNVIRFFYDVSGGNVEYIKLNEIEQILNIREDILHYYIKKHYQ